MVMYACNLFFAQRILYFRLCYCVELQSIWERYCGFRLLHVYKPYGDVSYAWLGIGLDGCFVRRGICLFGLPVEVYSGWLSGFATMYAIVFFILCVSQTFRGFISKLCHKTMDGVFRAPRALFQSCFLQMLVFQRRIQGWEDSATRLLHSCLCHGQ